MVLAATVRVAGGSIAWGACRWGDWGPVPANGGAAPGSDALRSVCVAVTGGMTEQE